MKNKIMNNQKNTIKNNKVSKKNNNKSTNNLLHATNEDVEHSLSKVFDYDFPAITVEFDSAFFKDCVEKHDADDDMDDYQKFTDLTENIVNSMQKCFYDDLQNVIAWNVASDLRNYYPKAVCKCPAYAHYLIADNGHIYYILSVSKDKETYRLARLTSDEYRSLKQCSGDHQNTPVAKLEELL